MSAKSPCTACSWSEERQNDCRYHSNVKLFYGVSNRGVWSLGTKLILKERPSSPPNFDVQNIPFLKEATTIPVPTIVEEWEEKGGSHFMLTKRITGQPLNEAWPTMSTIERERVAKQTADAILQLRQLQASTMHSLGGQPIYDEFLFGSGNGPQGPLTTDDELWAELMKALTKLKVPQKACERLRLRMPPAEPYTFTHGDLTNVNIMVDDGNLSGILDWESSGYFPVWWEYTGLGIGLGQEDKEWKTLVQKHVPEYKEAFQFFKDLYALRRYPNLNEDGIKLLEELMSD